MAKKIRLSIPSGSNKAHDSAARVKTILEQLFDGTRIRAIKDSDRIDKSFSFKASSGTSGTVKLGSVEYYFAVSKGELHVISNSELKNKFNNNASEFIKSVEKKKATDAKVKYIETYDRVKIHQNEETKVFTANVHGGKTVTGKTLADVKKKIDKANEDHDKRFKSLDGKDKDFNKKNKAQDNVARSLFNRLVDELGAELLLNELVDALGTDQTEENLKYVARMHDIDFEDDDEDDEEFY